VKTLGKGKYDPAIREELDKANWPEISPKLLKFADSKAWMLRATGIADVDHEDLIHEAILLAYGAGPNGTFRNWNKETYPELASFLISVIKSILNHKMDHHLTFKSDSKSLDDDSLDDCDLVKLSPKSPEEILKEEYALFNLNAAIDERVKGDQEIELVLRSLEDGVSKPRHIAEETGYDINKVNNILKRLRRRIHDLAPIN
jgi:DNA-directed RNA polymerase specialized sigma24 family protein